MSIKKRTVDIIIKRPRLPNSADVKSPSLFDVRPFFEEEGSAINGHAWGYIPETHDGYFFFFFLTPLIRERLWYYLPRPT